MRTACWTACLAGLFLVSFCPANDWPQWRGPNRDDVSKETGLLQEWPKGSPKLLWTCQETGFGYGSPSVVGDVLYIMGGDEPEKAKNEFVLALDTRTGKQVWKQPVESAGGDYDYGWGNGPRSTPTVDGDRLYALGARGDLVCLETKTGGKVWSVNLVKDLGGKVPHWGYSESVLVDGDHVICTPGGAKGSLAALDKKSGSVVWRSKDLTDAAHYASSIVAEVGGVRQYIQQTASSAVGVRASDGKLLWKEAPIKYNVAVIPTPVFHDNYVFLTAGYGAGCALLKLSPDSKGGTAAKVVYSNKMMQNHHGGVVRVGEYIYGHSDRGGWMCLDYLKMDKDTEDPVWKEGKKLGKGSLTYADGRLYCYSEGSGTLAMIEASPKGWIEKGRLELPQQTKRENRRRGGAIRAHPVVANGHLYLRDMDLLFCFEVAATH